MLDAICSQPGCPFGTSGRCLEGFDPPSTCPYQSKLPPSADEAVSFPESEFTDLPSGEALSIAQASDVAKDDKSTLVIIAGSFNSGKTTILTSLFEAFQEAPFANFQFRGSRTLRAFENRCHLGRVESGNDDADTTHTSMREGISFLHLALGSVDRSYFRHANLLLSDISGELFKRLRDSSEVAKEFSPMSRANHLCVVIDGEKLVARTSRHIARNDSRSILRSIIESDRLRPDCVIDIAVTKWDLVAATADTAEGSEVIEFINETKAILMALASRFVVRFHEIAARPERTAKVPFAHGLPTLLRSWMSEKAEAVSKTTLFLSGDNEFNRFTGAVLTKHKLEKVYDVRRL